MRAVSMIGEDNVRIVSAWWANEMAIEFSIVYTL